VIGGPGTGKTVAALQFLREGVRAGGRVAMLTQARPADLIDLAHSIGIDLTAHLQAGRWLLVRQGRGRAGPAGHRHLRAAGRGA
jgi:KaiC/GvpD/RAD55 family RecA-like ATPase